MQNPKRIILVAGIGFGFSFLLALITGAGFPAAMGRGLFSALIWGGITFGLLVAVPKLLLGQPSGQMTPQTGTVVDITLADDKDLDRDADGPDFDIRNVVPNLASVPDVQRTPAFAPSGNGGMGNILDDLDAKPAAGTFTPITLGRPIEGQILDSSAIEHEFPDLATNVAAKNLPDTRNIDEGNMHEEVFSVLEKASPAVVAGSDSGDAKEPVPEKSSSSSDKGKIDNADVELMANAVRSLLLADEGKS